jgi:hypothetical protein
MIMATGGWNCNAGIPNAFTRFGAGGVSVESLFSPYPRPPFDGSGQARRFAWIT